jgi:calcium-translocating P-type ATPase
VARAFALSSYVAGDPIPLGPEVASPADLGRAVGIDSLAAGSLLRLTAGVILVHPLTAPAEPTSLRWFRLPHAPPLGAPAEPTDVVVALTGPIGECGVAIRLAARLRACLGVPGVLGRARAAATREDLVRALATGEATGGESRLAPAELLALLASNPAGLAAAEASRRLAACGLNRLERLRQRPLALRFLEQFVSFFAVLLWIGGGLALLAGMPELSWAIFAVIAVNGVFSFFQEYRAERAIEALQQLLPRRITVRRDGRELAAPTAELVPGDVVRLEEGTQVPADGQLLEADALRVDQSTLTGESPPVFKRPAREEDRDRMLPSERPELLFGGTGVVSGSGTFVVTATGMATEVGAIAHLAQAVPEEPSPLQREMGRVTRIVTGLAVGFGVSFFLLGVASRTLRVHDALVFALGVIIANVPEGLLPTLTLALALGVQRMARQRSLLKRLSAVETLGATTVICTDKTGTLTENRMAARAVLASGAMLDLDAPDIGARPEVPELLEAAALACQATFDRGDPTELALLAIAARLGVDAEKARSAHPLVAAYPFDPYRKRMTLVRDTDGAPTAYVKGAPKETLALCATVRWDGRVVALDEARRRAILADHDRLAARGLRLLGVAVRRLPAEAGHGAAAVERELTFLGIIALWDPPRPEVPEAVALCRRAGIRVVVVTGDYGLTAQAIAREIGLPAEKVVTGEELDRLAPDALSALALQPGVLFARTSPAHKLAIVTALRERGEVVAVTGDGVNDAPALKGADIGVAMGQRGSDVAKEAAVMVLTDDNFASIVTAVRQGRAIYANVGKFITYIFTHNFAELAAFLVFVFARVPLPLTVMQILAVDLATDLLPALALGAEPPEPGVMDRPARQRTEALLSARRLLHAYGFLGAAEAALSLTAFLWTYWLAGWRPGLPLAASGALYQRATTMTLAGIVAAQVGNVLACRTERESVFRIGLTTNRFVLQGIVAAVGILVGLILIPPLARVFGLAPLRFAEWVPLLGFPLVMLALEETRKWVVRRWRRSPPSCECPS